jgi:tyrosine-protein kinase Etk/Wzc
MHLPYDADYREPALTESSGTLNVRELALMLRRHLWLILALGGVSAAGASWYVSRQPAEFAATGALQVVDPKAGLGSPGLGPLSSGTPDVLSQIQVLKSRSVAERAVLKQPIGLRFTSSDVPLHLFADVTIDTTITVDSILLRYWRTGFYAVHDGKAYPARYGQPVAFEGIQFTLRKRPPAGQVGHVAIVPLQTAASQLAKKLGAKPRLTTTIADVDYVGTNPIVAANIVNAVLQAFVNYSLAQARELSTIRREFLQEQLAQSESVHASAEEALANFRLSRHGISSTQLLTGSQSQFFQIDQRREELASERAAIADLLAKVQSASTPADRREAFQMLQTSSSAASNPVVGQLFTRLAALESARDSMSTGPFAASKTNPDYVRLEQSVSSTEQKLIVALRGLVASLDYKIIAVDSLKKRNIAELEKLPPVESDELRLVQREQAIRKIADDIQSEYQAARLAEGVAAGQVAILDLAIPGNRVASKGITKVLLALLVGLLLGAGVATLRENMNATIYSRDVLERMLKVPALAVIPKISIAAPEGARLRLRSLNPGGKKSSDLARNRVMIDQGNVGVGAEAYRNLRTNLLFTQARPLRSLIITSPAPGDGKTTTASNLAVVYARQGIRVLLIDADMRRARMHEVFDVPRTPGFSDVLDGNAQLQDAIHMTEIPGLSVMPAGRSPTNPSELLGGDTCKSLLRELSRDFGLVVIDSPPILAASDSSVLATMVDGALLVVRANKTMRDAAQRAAVQLRMVGANLIGTVLNDPSNIVPAYGGYNYYYSGYYTQKA